MNAEAGLQVGEAFVAALAKRDWPALRDCLDTEVQFRALVPNETKPFRDRHGPDAMVAQLQRWFDDSDVMELQSERVETVADRTHITYRFHGHEPDGWYVVEQQVYGAMGEHGFSSINLVCSGFRTVEPPV